MRFYAWVAVEISVPVSGWEGLASIGRDVVPCVCVYENGEFKRTDKGKLWGKVTHWLDKE